MFNLNLQINGKEVRTEIPTNLLLSEFLRYNLGLTGTHIGCDTSQCGACMVLLNQKSVKSCSILAAKCDKKEITTVEGLGSDKDMHEVQKSFKEKHGLQCGFCTPGLLMSAIEIKNSKLSSEKEIRDFLKGNFCRCTGYQNIVKSIIHFINKPNNNE